MNTCPKDRSELVFLGARTAPKGKRDATYLFCPECSTAILFLGRIGTHNPGPSTEGETVSWRYSRGAMEPLQEVPSEADRHERVLKEQLESFLKRRDNFGSYCSRDGTKARLLLDLGDLKFVWCGWCKLGFAFYRDPLYGWPQVGSFGFDASKRSYSPRELKAPEAMRERFLTGLTQLAPPR
ncbi:MAG TPA: hypothetical protein VEN81_05050 [Planctomycetota bacterium]|nr:hypothetical protein [Planctomycetota bacterium]